MSKANEMLSHLSQFTSLEDNHPFVECATFADEIKSRGWNDQSALHYVNIPFFDKGFNGSYTPDPDNATWAIVSFTHLINTGHDNSELEALKTRLR